MTIRQLAEQIARDLFTNGQGDRADRLYLMAGYGFQPRDLGGWSEEAMADRIEDALRAARLDESLVLVEHREVVP